MARRREVEDDDGLELFLSTSCDSFGGIVFIMLLIRLLPTKKMDVMLEDLNQSKKPRWQRCTPKSMRSNERARRRWTCKKQFELHHQDRSPEVKRAASPELDRATGAKE